jgi:cytoskeletal protein CcmA (bactofilin family)
VGVLGKVKGQIEAPLIQIDGWVEGSLRASKLVEVLKNARIEGDIFTPSGGLKIMIGGEFEGNFVMESASQF